MVEQEKTTGGRPERISPFSDQELDHFKALLLKKRLHAVEDVARMREQISDSNANDDTAYGYHMADAGTDAMEREKLYLMIGRQQKFIGYLDRALRRIDNKTYGVCKVTGEPIARERLEAVPHTEISMAAKQKQK